MTARKIKKIIKEALKEKKDVDTDAAVEEIREYCTNTLCSSCRYAIKKQERGNDRMGIYRCTIGHPRGWRREIGDQETGLEAE